MLGIHVDKKTIYGPCDEARAIRRAVDIMRGIEVPLPILFGRRCLGLAVGERDSDRVLISRRGMTPAEVAGFPTLLSIQQAAVANRLWDSVFSKTMSPQSQQWWDSWPAAGSPVAGTYTGAAFTSRQFDDTTVGALYHGGNVTPYGKFILTMQANITGTASAYSIIYDRVLSYEACTFNASVLQNFTNSLAAQRWVSAGQPGLQVTMTATTTSATGSTASNLTQLAYTNQAGTAGQAAPCSTPALAIAASANIAGVNGSQVLCPNNNAAAINGPFLPLAVQDSGVRLLSSFTTSAANTGTMAFVLNRPLGLLMMQANGIEFETDFVFQRLSLGQVYDGACLAFLFCPSTSTVSNFEGRLRSIWN